MCRDEQPSRVYRLRTRSADHQPARAMVASASQVSPVHHPTEVHRSLRATDEPQDKLLQQDTRARRAAATASGSAEQAACSGGPSGADAGSVSSTVRLRQHASRSAIPSSASLSTAATHVQQHVLIAQLVSARCTSALCWASSGLWSPDERHAAIGQPDAPGRLRTGAESVRSGHDASWPTTSLDHGPAARRHPSGDSTCCQPSRSQCAHSVTAQSSVLSTATGWCARRQCR